MDLLRNLKLKSWLRLFNITYDDMTKTTKKGMNNKREHFGITYDSKNKYVYVIGGWNDCNVIAHCEACSVEMDVWIELEPMIKTHHLLSACMFNSQFIFVFGGNHYYSPYTFDKYSIHLSSWEAIQIKRDIRLLISFKSISFFIHD